MRPEYRALLDRFYADVEAATRDAQAKGIVIITGDYGLERRGGKWATTGRMCPVGALILARGKDVRLEGGQTAGHALAHLYGLNDDAVNAFSFSFDGRPELFGHLCTYARDLGLRLRREILGV